jgi:hypothetical protein
MQTSSTTHSTDIARPSAPTLTALERAAIEWMLEDKRVKTCALDETRGVTTTASRNPEAFKRSLKMAILNSSDARARIDRWVELYKKELDLRYGIGDRPETYPMGLN